jgi:isochorismate pyruvate lyase
MSLDDLRRQIDALDAELVRVLAQREQVVHEISKCKVDEQAVRDPSRVEAVVTQARQRIAANGGSPALAERVYRAMVGFFIERQLEDLVARRGDAQASGAESPSDTETSPSTTRTACTGRRTESSS